MSEPNGNGNPTAVEKLSELLKQLGKLDEIAALLKRLLEKDQRRPPRLLRLVDAASYLAVSEGTLRRLISEHELRVVKIYEDSGHSPHLVDIHDLDMLIERTKS